MNKVKFLYALVCSMFLAACSEEENLMPAGRTGIQVALTEKASVETRKTPEELTKPLAKEFHLKITNAAGKSVYDAGYTSELIPASAGTYTVEATYGDNSELAVDAPYYKGEAEVEVTDGKNAKETIYCKVANALASVEFNNTGAYTFEDQFSSYAVKVEVSNLSTELKGDGESAYYRASSRPTFTFVGTLKDGGEEVEVPLEDDKFSQAATFAAGVHCVITLKLGASTPGVRVEVSKVEVKDVTINETIPMEWLPKPKVEAEGFDANNTLTFVETETKNAKLNLNLASALQEMKLKFNFEDPQFATLNGQEYLLSKDKATLESTLGITLPNIDDKEASIDLSALVDKLQTNAGTPTTNALTIDVQANNRWSSEDTEKKLTYTLNCNKPEFSVAVQEGNCWSKTFVIDEPTISSGNADILKSKLVYQYKEKGADDSSWQTCSNGLEQVFSDHPDKKEYQVRAFYREGIISNVVDVTLETTTQIPNSDMEEWWIETKKKSGFASSDKTYYTFHPYTEGAANTSWWDTNNDKAQGGTLALGIWYEGCFASCVSYTEDASEGYKAALIYVSGCGDGYANTSGSYVGGAMVGSLFIGSYNSGIVQGHNFESRPTSMSFWYKYKPYNTDAFKVVVSLKNGDKDIATGTYEPKGYSAEDNVYQQATVNFNYVDDKSKATTICVQFLASNKTSLSESDFAWGTNITYPIIGNWTVHMGSILKVDDISLVYDK